MRHVIWDWNGTLFDDLSIVVDAVNVSLTQFESRPITANDYRDHYTRPVFRFYERLLGREVTAAEWEAIDISFHDAYRSRLGRAGLTGDALAAIETVARRRVSQSLLSMWWHDELLPATTSYDVARWMVRIDGNRGEAGETKTVHLDKHVQALQGLMAGLDSSECLVIGDSLDDAVAAADVGVACVLYDGGSHHRAELDAAGVPVAATLIEALALGGIE